MFMTNRFVVHRQLANTWLEMVIFLFFCFLATLENPSVISSEGNFLKIIACYLLCLVY